MFKLKQILGVDWKRTCFCGKPIVGNICEIHGTDIRVSANLIHAQFVYKKLKDETGTIKDGEIVNVSLTENQFLNLFQKRTIEEHFINTEEYRVVMEQYGSNTDVEDILENFMSMLDYDLFFDMKRLKEVTVTKSGVFINFLFDYELLEQNTMKLTFNAIILRNVQDYISWRLAHFQAKQQNIIKSLLGNRSNVVATDGKLFTIEKVKWTNADFPDSIIVSKKTESENQMIKKPNELYQDESHFFLSPRLERKVFSALQNFSQQFIKSLKQFFIAQSCLATFEKIKPDKTVFYQKLIGQTVKLNTNLIETIESE